MVHVADPTQAMEVISQYGGQFSPEFEYEEWAISWRTRVHALFLELTNASIKVAVRTDALEAARDLALLGLDRDPGALDIERKLVWILWHMGSRSAAAAHYDHLVHADERDGIDATTLEETVEGELP
jgi:two-component SAPR family response regulator